MFRKNMKKAFTLVEMLIVVIIIGILMGALLPKLRGAQERARDTARKANLANVGSALMTYVSNEGTYPTWLCLKDIEAKIVPAYIWELPQDPQKGRIAYWTKDGGCSKWDYAYTSLYSKWTKDWGYVMIANTEAEWSVNNYVLPETTTKVIALFSGTVSSSSYELNNRDASSVAAIKNLSVDDMKKAGQWSNTNLIWSTDVADKLKCKDVYIAASGDSVTMCNRVSATKINTWKARTNNSMVYVQFN